jgi:hypothetical protein
VWGGGGVVQKDMCVCIYFDRCAWRGEVGVVEICVLHLCIEMGMCVYVCMYVSR